MSQPTDPFGVPPQSKAGMSTSGKVLLGLGLGCGVVLVLCCGGLAIVGYGFAKNFKAIQEPGEIREIAQNIVSCDIPPSLQPTIAVSAAVPFVGKRIGSLAEFQDKSHGMLLLAEISPEFGDPAKMRVELENGLRSQGHEIGEGTIKLENVETFATKINGEDANFEYGSGKNEEGAEMWQAAGAFKGNEGTGFLTLVLDSSQFTKDDVLAFLKSLK